MVWSFLAGVLIGVIMAIFLLGMWVPTKRN
jgi:hypothetical protein